MAAWINLGSFTCDGPTDIVIRSDQDAGAYNTIRGMLAASSRPIDLQTRAGLRGIKPQASLAPRVGG